MRLVPDSFPVFSTFKPQCVAVILVTGDAAKRMNQSIFATRAPRPCSEASAKLVSGFEAASFRGEAILTKESPTSDVLALLAQIERFAP
jgi:hypothetical protein